LAGATILLASATTLAQGTGDWLKCRSDADCAMIKGACGPGAANRQYITQAQQREDDIAASIRRDPKGPVQCQGWVDDPYANAKATCVAGANMCSVTWPGASPPRLK